MKQEKISGSTKLNSEGQPLNRYGRLLRGKVEFRPIVVKCPQHGEFNAEECPRCLFLRGLR